MGGGYYDRDVGVVDVIDNRGDSSYTSASISSVVQQSNLLYNNPGFSSAAAKVVGVEKRLNPELDPKKYSETKIKISNKHPIVFALDVTASMGDWSKIIYDKMPMFYGQILMQKYLTDPAISVAAIGDYFSDECPFQVSKFAQGMDIDNLIAKLYLEGGGGGTFYESYELGAYFYTSRVEFKSNVEIPFFFLTGDEGFYDKLPAEQAKRVCYTDVKTDINSRERFKILMKKYNVFLIKKPYEGPNEEKILKQWNETIGPERVLMIKHPKACIDVMLGAIAITTGSRNLDGYIEDMRARQQTDDRINEVVNALKEYNNKVLSNSANIVVGDNVVDLNDVLLSVPKTNFKEIQLLVDKAGIEDSKIPEGEIRKDMEILNKTYKTDTPNEFLCPITEEIFVDPVMTCDGYTYERKAIELWFQSHNTSPATNLTLANKNLMPNVVLRNLIKNFLASKK